jgi:hypothetical protein
MTTNRWHRAQLNIRWLWSMTGLLPPRTGRRGHRRRYSAHQLCCYRFGGSTEAQTVTPTAWASSSRWRPCFTVRIGGWSPERLSRRRWAKRRCDRCRPAVGAVRSGATTTSMTGDWREPAPRYAPARNHIHYVRSEGGENQTPGASTSVRTGSTRLRAEEEENQIQQKTRSTRLTPGGENHIQRLRAKRTRTPTTT